MGIRSIPTNRKMAVQPPSRKNKIPNTGPSSTYRPDPGILKQIKAVDEHLDLEWRPNGRIQGHPPGCWRVPLRGNSGVTKGLFLWPPGYTMQTALLHHINNTWKRKLFLIRSAQAATCQEDYERYMRQMNEKKKEPFNKWWDTVDHGETYRALKAENEAPKWRGNWQVPAKVEA